VRSSVAPSPLLETFEDN